VTENHLTSTGLSQLSIDLTTDTRVTRIEYNKARQGIMQQRLQTTPERNASIKVKHYLNICKQREKCFGACLSRSNSGGDQGTPEVLQHPPRRLRAPPMAAPRAALPAPRV
jgi:hypothetical protein